MCSIFDMNMIDLMDVFVSVVIILIQIHGRFRKMETVRDADMGENCIIGDVGVSENGV